MINDNMKTKTCINCKVEKNIDEFALSKGKVREKCKDCLKQYMNDHYKSNKKKYFDYATKRSNELRDWYKNLKKTLCCEKCKENHPAVLEFHHTDPKLKDFSIADALWHKLSKTKIENEISKCIVLCSNCHRKLHWEENNL